MTNKFTQFTKVLVSNKASKTVRKLQHFGGRYACSICKSNLKTMLPFGMDVLVLKEKQVVGGGLRPMAKCPVCGSLDRERLIHLYLLHKTTLFTEPHILLHLAPEFALEQILSKIGTINYLTADITPNKAMAQMDVTQIQYPDESFDAIICNHVLEHIPNDTLAMSELYRVLVPGGWAILQVPISLSLDQTYEDNTLTSNWEREAAFGQIDHVRIYAKDYVDRLQNVGFEVDVFDWTQHPAKFGGPNNKYNLIENEKLFIAHKPK